MNDPKRNAVMVTNLSNLNFHAKNMLNPIKPIANNPLPIVAPSLSKEIETKMTITKTIACVTFNNLSPIRC